MTIKLIIDRLSAYPLTTKNKECIELKAYSCIACMDAFKRRCDTGFSQLEVHEDATLMDIATIAVQVKTDGLAIAAALKEAIRAEGAQFDK